MPKNRIAIGVWFEANPGDQWANQGMTRLLGFILEGVAKHGGYEFHIVVPDYIKLEAEADLGTLEAVSGLDYFLHSPSDAGFKARDFRELAFFANAHVPVSGWLTLFPQYDCARYLEAPVTAIFPDAIPVVFTDFNAVGWGKNGFYVQWVQKVERLLSSVDRVVTFSDHVARDQVVRMFGLDPSQMRIIRVAPPDLSTLLPYLEGRERTVASRVHAAHDLRRYASAKRWRYLSDFPFEEVPFIAVSTQDRVTKNIRIVAEAVRRLVRDEHTDIRMFMTAPLSLSGNSTPLSDIVKSEQNIRDIISMPDLPRPVHAAFYHAAEMAIHPSIFEGGMGTFPFYEAVSVATPCLMADGPHQREMVAQVPAIASYTFDPNDAADLMRLIKYVRANREQVLQEQVAIYEQLCARGWDDVALAYASAATESI